MSRHFYRLDGRRLLLLAALLAGASWGGMAHAQASKTGIAQAEVDLAQAKFEAAQAKVALEEAKLNLIKGGGQARTSAGSSVQKTAAVEEPPTPKSTPELGKNAADESTSDEETGASNGAEAGDGGEEANGANGNGGETEKKKIAAGRKEFGGLEFGVGISFTLDVGQNDRVTEAELVNGLVRVKDEDNGRARIMLESHYFFKPCQGDDGNPMPREQCSLPFGLKGGDFGFGPFIALQPGTEEIIQAVAIGAMVGFRRPGTGTESFNLGLGIVIDPNTRILGDGIKADQPLPVGETAIRYKEKMQTGLLLLASFGF